MRSGLLDRVATSRSRCGTRSRSSARPTAAPCGSATSSSGGWPGSSAGSSCSTPRHPAALRRASGRTARRRCPRARAPATTGRPFRCCIISGADAQRSSDEIELGGAALRVDHAVGIGDAHVRAAAAAAAVGALLAAALFAAAVRADSAVAPRPAFAGAFASGRRVRGATASRMIARPACRCAGRGRPAWRTLPSRVHSRERHLGDQLRLDPVPARVAPAASAKGGWSARARSSCSRSSRSVCSSKPVPTLPA